MTFNMWGVEEKLLPQSRPSTFMSQNPLNIALMGGGGAMRLPAPSRARPVQGWGVARTGDIGGWSPEPELRGIRWNCKAC